MTHSKERKLLLRGLKGRLTASAFSITLLAAAGSGQSQQPPPLPPSAPPAIGQPAPDPRAAAINKYFDQGYNYADAKVLGAFWGVSPFDAKFRLGSKMLRFGPADGQIHIRNARADALKKPVTEMPVWFTDGGYTFGDAERLGKFWGRGILEAKYKMTRLLVSGNDAAIKAALKAAGAAGTGAPHAAPEPERDPAAFRKFHTQGYNYADAKVLGAFWGQSALDAKYRLGTKMLNFGPEDGALHMRNARAAALTKPVPEMPVWFTDGGYTFDDAVVLGKFWGRNLLESKYKMTRLLVEGNDAAIKAALRAARQ